MHVCALHVHVHAHAHVHCMCTACVHTRRSSTASASPPRYCEIGRLVSRPDPGPDLDPGPGRRIHALALALNAYPSTTPYLPSSPTLTPSRRARASSRTCCRTRPPRRAVAATTDDVHQGLGTLFLTYHPLFNLASARTRSEQANSQSAEFISKGGTVPCMEHGGRSQARSRRAPGVYVAKVGGL